MSVAPLKNNRNSVVAFSILIQGATNKIMLSFTLYKLKVWCGNKY